MMRRRTNGGLATSGLRRAVLLAGLALLGPAAVSGCSSLGGPFGQCPCLDDMIIAWRNGALARKAWYRHKHQFAGCPFMRDARAGFIQGYVDVADGGDGCTPVVPPEQYWSWKYQSPEGRARVNAWFQAYPHGAKAAEQDGVGNWSALPINRRPEMPLPEELQPAAAQPTPAAEPGPPQTPPAPPSPEVEQTSYVAPASLWARARRLWK